MKLLFQSGGSCCFTSRNSSIHSRIQNLDEFNNQFGSQTCPKRNLLIRHRPPKPPVSSFFHGALPDNLTNNSGSAEAVFYRRTSGNLVPGKIRGIDYETDRLVGEEHAPNGDGLKYCSPRGMGTSASNQNVDSMEA